MASRNGMYDHPGILGIELNIFTWIQYSLVSHVQKVLEESPKKKQM